MIKLETLDCISHVKNKNPIIEPIEAKIIVQITTFNENQIERKLIDYLRS